MTAVAVIVLLALAFLAGLAARKHVPELIAYLVVGAAVGPSGAGLIGKEQLVDLRPLTIAATALVLVGIGERLSFATFRAVPWVAALAPIGYIATGVAVFVATRAAGASSVLAALLATFAGGGAPMTVAAIVRREHSESPYARALVALHASCDALVSLTFAVVLPIAIVHAGTASSTGRVATDVLRLGVAGAAIGVAAGWSARRCAVALPSRWALAATSAHVFGAVAVSWALGCSVPLTALAIGAVIGSTPAGHPARTVFKPIHRIEPGLYLLFFVLAGAAIRLDAVAEFGMIGIVYLATRAAVKLVSALVTTRLTSLTVSGGLRVGLGSIPHAGVTAALAAAASAALPGRGIATITLGGIVVFETAGALLVRAQLRQDSARLRPRAPSPTAIPSEQLSR